VPALSVDVDQPASPMPMPNPPRSLDCPTCGYPPSSIHEVAQHREELETVWLFSDPDQLGRVVERWHCSQYQPHQVEMVMCGQCGATVMLGGDLAAGADQTLSLREPAARWLIDRGWSRQSRRWECGSH
jgi:hypothetical protein